MGERVSNDVAYGHPAWIEIDLQQFRKNLQLIKTLIGKAKFCLPVKSNAYGHGLIPIAQTAVESGVDYLGVSCLQEGALLRQAGIKNPIIVFGAIHEQQIPELIDYALELSISSEYKAELVAAYCEKMLRTCKVHLELDTGMCRTGVKPDTAVKLLQYLEERACFEIVGVYSHLATADLPESQFTLLQMNLFETFINKYIRKTHPSILCHIANSGSLCHYPLSSIDMVRPGLLAYGYFPSSHISSKLKGIAPILSLKTKIAYCKTVSKGQGISYGRTYITKEPSRIVTVPVGYGDGYRRALSNKAQVLIREKAYPVVGNICMDQFMVNLVNDEAYVGDEVVLIGKQGDAEISLIELAKLCDTIVYEMLCGFNARLPRVYK